jgi:hypothetical protein
MGCTLMCTLAGGISMDSGGRRRKTGRRISALHRHLRTHREVGGVSGFFLKTGGRTPLQVRILCPPLRLRGRREAASFVWQQNWPHGGR